MISDDEFIALFNSPTRVLKAEKVLRKSGIPCRLIPAPRDVAEGCALALCFASEERLCILSELGRQDLLPRRMYHKYAGLFKSIPVSPGP